MTTERRRFERVVHTVSVECRRTDDSVAYWYKGLTLNVSVGGLALQSVFLFDVGTVLELQIKFSDRPDPLRLYGRVVWVQPDGLNEHGVEFLDMTAPQQARIDDLVRFLTKRL